MEDGAEHRSCDYYMAHLADLSGLEADAMGVVQARRSVTARDVYDELSRRQQVAYTTVMSTLDGLATKGYVDQVWLATAKYYAVAARDVAVARSIVNDVIANLLAGDAQPVIDYLEHRRNEAEQAA